MENRTSILCVDDPDAYFNMAGILTDLGYHVDVAYGTLGALRSLGLNNYAVGIFTCGTSSVDGIELRRQMNKGEGRHACVMLASDIHATPCFSPAAGCFDPCLVLMNPIDVASLVAFIHDFAEDPDKRCFVNQPAVKASVPLRLEPIMNTKTTTAATHNSPEDVRLICALVARTLEVSDEDLTAETLLIEDLATDSIDRLALAQELERGFDVVIPDAALNRVRTIGDIILCIELLSSTRIGTEFQ